MLHKKITAIADEKQKAHEALDQIAKSNNEYLNEKQRLDKELVKFEDGRPTYLDVLADIELENILTSAFIQLATGKEPTYIKSLGNFSSCSIASERSTLSAAKSQQSEPKKDDFQNISQPPKKNVLSRRESQLNQVASAANSSLTKIYKNESSEKSDSLPSNSREPSPQPDLKDAPPEIPEQPDLPPEIPELVQEDNEA